VATAGVNVSTQRGPLGPFAADTAKVLLAKKAGAQTVAALAATETIYNDTDRPWTILATRATVGTAPTGATFIADVLLDGTSIFATTTANRPTIAVTEKTAKGGAPDTVTVPAGSALTFAVTQIGSTVAGSDLVVQVTVVPA
jgi:thiamine biosynthesis protein ThiC